MSSPCSANPPPDFPAPLRLEPAWLTDTVLALARGVAADNGFDRLPILADALEDEGCDNLPLLTHLRRGESHRVECWALRAVLRTTLMLPGAVPITFAYCPPGSFLMGSDHPAAAEFTDERPVHRVTLSQGFYAGIHPVTQAQWRAVMGTDPSHFKGDDRPVEEVSWEDAQLFCTLATVSARLAIRLPTEAEWEYACRAGTTTEFHFGDVISDRLANYNYRESWNGSPRWWTTGHAETTAVGMFPANPWGLFDCHGNVWEWCEDLYDEDYYEASPTSDPTGPNGETAFRTLRGGSWNGGPEFCRSARRNAGESSTPTPVYSFRVVFTA